MNLNSSDWFVSPNLLGIFSIELKGLGVDETKLGETLGEAWEEEDEESMEQERFVSKPESTEFFLSADFVLSLEGGGLSSFPLESLLESSSLENLWDNMELEADLDLGVISGVRCPSLL